MTPFSTGHVWQVSTTASGKTDTQAETTCALCDRTPLESAQKDSMHCSKKEKA